MKKKIALLCSAMLLVGCSGGGSTTTTTTTPKPEPTQATTVANTPLYTVTASSNDYLTVPEDDDVVVGYAGDTLHTAFFDFKVNGAALYDEYVDIVGDDDSYVIAIDLTVSNPYDVDVEMYDTDFILYTMDEDGDIDAEYSYWPETVNGATAVGDMLEDIYTVDAGGNTTGDLVFIVPNTERDFVLFYVEEYADETYGDYFYVVFSFGE